MARKPLSVAILVIALLIAGWWIARGSRSGDSRLGLGPQPESSATGDHTGVDLAPPAANQERAPIRSEPSTAEPSADPDTPSAFSVRGKVVDARRFRAADVEVRLVRADGATRSVRSDESGRFEFRIPARPEEWESVTLWALRDETSAVAKVWLPGSQPAPSYGFLQASSLLGDVEAGTLALRPARSLHLSIVDAGRPASQAEVVVRSGVDPTPLWRGTCDVAGKSNSPPLPDGCTEIQAARAGAEGRARVFLPEEQDVRIELAPRFDALVTVLAKESGAPIPGAVLDLDEDVAVPSSENSRSIGLGEYHTHRAGAGGTATTDAQGVARFPDLSASPVYRLRVRAPGFEPYPSQGSSGGPVGSAEPNVTIKLARAASRSVRWPIEAGEVPLPPEGARITLTTAPGSGREIFGEAPAPPREGIVRDGQVVAESIEGRGFFLGTAPDGSIARFYVEETADVGMPASFRKARTIGLSIRDGDGKPVARVLAQARNQGNNPLGGPASTGSDGLAELTGLYGDLADVYVLGPTPGAREVKAGSVDLERGDGRIEFVLPASVSMRVRLGVRIGGNAQLPPVYQLRSAIVLDEIPELGELLLDLALPETGTEVGLTMSALGFLPARVQVPIVRDGTESLAVLDLERSSMLTAVVTRPRTNDWIEVKVQIWNEAKQAWTPVSNYYKGLSTPNGPGGSYRFFQLAPGRYQVLEERSQITSEPVDIVAGQAEARVALDLEGIEWVSGRVEVPDTADLARVVVLSDASRSSSLDAWLPGMQAPEGASVSADGSFRTQVRRGAPTRLRAWHPWLAPSDPDGEIVVDGGREGVVLRLASLDQVRIAVPQLVELAYLTAARVGVYDGPAEGQPHAWLHAPLVDGALRFTGVARGRATLWIDPGREYAPLVLADVEIGEGLTDLGTARFSRGSSVRVRQSVKEGQAAARIYISVRRDREPMVFRDLNSRGEAISSLSGIGAGSYSVSFGAIMGGGRNERQIEFDGVSDVELELP